MFARISFAPDLVPEPHIGHLHTAVHAWALALGLSGDFILPFAAANWRVALSWLGIEGDEEPPDDIDSIAGRTASRQETYRSVLARLVSGGHAVEEAGGVRLRLPRTGKTVLPDGLRGAVTFANSRLAEPMLVDEHGRFHPLFTAIVDEHEQAITHAVRSATWLPDAPIAYHLCQQLGWLAPTYIHLPPLLNSQGQPCHNPAAQKGHNLADLQAEGYLPQAVWHYLLLLGWTPPGDPDRIDRWMVRQQYRLERVTPEPVTFSWDSLCQVNRLYMQRLSDEEVMAGIRPFLEDAYEFLPTDPKWLLALTRAIRPGLSVYADAVTQAAWAFDGGMELTLQGRAALAQPHANAILTRLVAELAAIVLLDEPTAQVILTALRNAFPPPADVETAVCAALTGHAAGPPLPAVLALLGKQRAMQRLAVAVKREG